MNRIFLSYARGDDEPFVKRLHADLSQAGFAVWFDREALRSRGLTFHQEIKDAIRTEVDRVVYIGGPKAAISDYVREEWQFALACDHVVVSPVLRLGDYSNVPGELSLLHCEDFRDDTKYAVALDKLLTSLRQPNPKLGALFAVPTLPVNFLGRPELMRQVRDALLVDLQKPQAVTSADACVGIQGMGGIGKSVLAAALARNRQVRQSYPDGIVWISFGQNLTDEDLLKRQRELTAHLGGDDRFSSLAQGQSIIRELLSAKAVLLVLDDVWRAADAKAFDMLGPRCRMLVSTRDAGILHSLHGEQIPVSLLDEVEALQLLADAVGLEPSSLPAEAHDVVRKCGLLPLALALCGGMVKKRGGNFGSVLERLRRADLEKIADRESINEQHQSLWRAMDASVNMLSEDEQKRFAELAVFSSGQSVPEAAAAVLWSHTGSLDDLDAEELLINFAERSLIQLDQKAVSAGEASERHFHLHDLLHDFASRLAGEPRALQQKLLDAYHKKCPTGWPSGPDDGYFLQNLCHHLINAGIVDEAVTLLSDLPWIEVRCRVGHVFELIGDYHMLLEVWPDALEEVKAERLQTEQCARYGAQMAEYARTWSLLRDRQDTAVAANTQPSRSPEEAKLPTPPPSCRIWSEKEIDAECQRIIAHPARLDRLRMFEAFVESQCYPLLEFGKRPGFVAQHAFNHSPAGPVHESGVTGLPIPPTPCLLRRWTGDATLNLKPACLRTLEGHNSNVNSVSVTPDGRRAVSGSGDYKLRVWDLESGACLRTLEGHESGVNSVSVTPDGRIAVSGSGDNKLRVWDLESGACLRTLEGHESGVNSVSVTPDGRIAVSGSGDNKLRVWDLASGTCLQTLKDHNSYVNSVCVMPDGLRAVSASWDNTLRVWDLKSGDCLQTLKGRDCLTPEGCDCGINSVSVTPNGQRAVSASYKTLLLWDMESGTCLRTIEGHSGWINGVSVTPDGRLAISGSNDKTVRVWDLESGTCLRTIEGHSGPVFSVSVTPDGRLAASASADTTVRVWDLESGACLQVRNSHTKGVNSVSVTPDGRRAISGSDDKMVRVWDAESGACLQTMEGHSGRVRSVGVTPDGRKAVSGSDDKTVRVWDTESGACVGVLSTGATVVATAICPGKMVVGLSTGEVLTVEVCGTNIGPDEKD